MTWGVESSTPGGAAPHRGAVVPWAHAVGVCMVPVTLLMGLWVWVGRSLFGATLGWMAILLPIYGAIPLLILLVPAVVVWGRSRGHRPRMLLRPWEAGAQLTVWGAMFVLGLSIVDMTDGPDDSSALTTLGLATYGPLASALLAGSLLILAIAGLALLIGVSAAGDPRGRPAAGVQDVVGAGGMRRLG